MASALTTSSLTGTSVTSSSRLSRRRGRAQCFRAVAAQKKGSGKNDESEYPSKSMFAGGWAGGEVGLKDFLQKTPPNSKWPRPGFKPGGNQSKGSNFDPQKYPSRDPSGLAGGFAGGERGLQAFVKEGDIKLAPPNARRQFSPLLVAIIAAFAGTAGGLFLTFAEQETAALEKDAEGAIAAVARAPLDSNTKLLLQVAVGLLLLTAIAAGLRAAAKSGQESAD